MLITYWKRLSALNAREKRREANTIKIGINALNNMVNSLLITDKNIAFREFGQNVVN